MHQGAFLSTVGFGAVLGVAAWLVWRGRFWWPVLLVAAASLAVRLPQSPVPIFNIDEAINAAIAIRLQEGAVLYGGVWDHKPPLSFYLYRLIFDLFGPWNMTAVHAVGAFLYSGTAILTGLVARQLLPRAVAAWAALLLVPYSLLYYRYDFMATNHELGGLPFLLLCVLLFWKALRVPDRSGPADAPWRRRHARWLWLVGAGAAGAVGGLFREACAMVVPVSLLFLLIRPWLRQVPPPRGSSRLERPAGAGAAPPADADAAPAAASAPESWRHAGADAAAFAFGVAIPLVIFVVWLLAHGVARDAYYLMITHNLRYRAAGRHGLDWLAHAVASLRSLIRYAPALWMAILAAAAVLAVRVARMLFRRGPAEPQAVYLALWCLGAAYMVGQGGRFHGHYFLPFYPPLMVLTAGFLGGLRLPSARERTEANGARGPQRRRKARANAVRLRETQPGDASGSRRGGPTESPAGAEAPPASTGAPAWSRLFGPALLTLVLLSSVFSYYRYQGRDHSRCVERFVLGREEVGAGFRDIQVDRNHVAAAKVATSMSGPQEPIFVWGFCPQIYVLAHRRPATRFTFTPILSGRTVEGRTIRTEPRSWDYLKSDLERERPVLVLDASSLFLKDTPLEEYPEFRAWLMERYRPVVEVQGCRFYERNDRKPTELVP